MERFVSAFPTPRLICSRYRLLCEETTRLQQVRPIDLDADSDDLETDPVIRDSRLILDPGLLLIVSLLLVASTEIFRFLLFLGFWGGRAVLAVPEEEEEKVEVEVDPGEDP